MRDWKKGDVLVKVKDEGYDKRSVIYCGEPIAKLGDRLIFDEFQDRSKYGFYILDDQGRHSFNHWFIADNWQLTKIISWLCD